MVSSKKHLEKIVVLASIPNSIEDLYISHVRYKYFESIGKPEILEAYSKLNLSPDIISNTLVKLLYTYNQSNKLSDGVLLDLLNTEFLKVNVVFDVDNTFRNVRYPNSGIVRADTGERIYIYINDKFFDILKNTDITSLSKDFNDLCNDLFSMYSHEATHSYQINHAKKELDGIKDPNNRKAYLGNPQEIDAHAREFANILLNTGKSFSEIKDLLTNNSKKLLNNKIWQEYWKYFGSYIEEENYPNKKDREWRVNIFKKFKKRIYDFLLLDKRFMYESKSVYKMILF